MVTDVKPHVKKKWKLLQIIVCPISEKMLIRSFKEGQNSLKINDL